MTLKIRGKDLLWRTVGDEVVAIDLKSSRYLRVNSSGALLWQHLQQHTSHEELIDALVDGYGLSREQAAGDLETFLAMLAENELLEP